MRTFGEAPPPPTFFDRLKSGLAKTGLGDNPVAFTERSWMPKPLRSWKKP